MKRRNLFKGGPLARKKQSIKKKKTNKKLKKSNKPGFTITKAGIKATAWLGVLILAGGLGLWWNFIFTDAEKTFEGMLHQSLKTSSVTREISQQAGTQTLEQINRLQFGADTAVVGQTTISQTGASAATVVTEEIGTPELDYVRYVAIETSQRDEDGEQIDFEEVIGVWGVSQATPGQPQAAGESFSEAVLGVIPFANLSGSERRELVEFAIETNVYELDKLGITKETENGRPVYTYPVLLQPEAYVGYLQRVAGAMGLTQLENVNPADFRGVAPIRFTVRVDMLSRQPIDLQFSNQTDREETLRDFGVIQPVKIPEDPIPAIELQQRIQSLQ